MSILDSDDDVELRKYLISFFSTTNVINNDRYLTVTTYHSHSPPIGTYVTCSQKRRLNHHLTPLAMSFIKYHAKTATPHTVVKHVAHFT